MPAIYFCGANMPDSMNAANQLPNVERVPLPSDDFISPQRRDQIYEGITDAEWDKYRDFEQVAIGRRTPGEPYAIMLGFHRGPSEELADFAMALPPTASFFIAWHRNVIRAAVERGEL